MLQHLPLDTMLPTDIMWVVLCHHNEREGGHEDRENYNIETDNDENRMVVIDKVMLDIDFSQSRTLTLSRRPADLGLPPPKLPMSSKAPLDSGFWYLVSWFKLSAASFWNPISIFWVQLPSRLHWDLKRFKTIQSVSAKVKEELGLTKRWLKAMMRKCNLRNHQNWPLEIKFNWPLEIKLNWPPEIKLIKSNAWLLQSPHSLNVFFKI